jgi:hypothetical protein
MKKITLLILFINSVSNAFAQQITFQKKIEQSSVWVNEVPSVAALNDNTYILSSLIDSLSGPSGLYFNLTRIDSIGNIIWSKTYGNNNDESWVSFPRQTSDGSIVITGSINVSNAPAKIFLAKLDLSGNVIWSKLLGSTSTAWVQPYETTDKGFVITGSSYNGINADYYLIKTDSLGDVLWTKTYGDSTDIGELSVIQTNDGGYILLGRGTATTPGQDALFVIKTDSQGNIQWSKSYDNSNEDNPGSIHQTADNGFLITAGAEGPGYNCCNLWVIKLDILGNVQWEKKYKRFDNVNAFFSSLLPNGEIITGAANYNASSHEVPCLIKMDSLANILWCKKYPSLYGYFFDIAVCPDGGFIQFGEDIDYDTLAIVKSDANGNSPTCSQINYSPVLMNSNTIVSNHTFYVDSTGTFSNFNLTFVNAFPVMYDCIPTSIEENSVSLNEQVEVIPNPFSDKLTITSKTNEPLEITLFDITSRKLLQQQFTNSTSINTSYLSKGIYIYELRTKNAVIKKGKVVKD